MIHLAQHFLINSSAIKKIVGALDIQKNETIIEIGPGRGALTKPLLQQCIQQQCQLIAIEKDSKLANSLWQTTHNENFKIVIEDAIDYFSQFNKTQPPYATNYKLIGNIPYYITGKLLRTLSELSTKPQRTILMIQKEVAERLCAQPPQMNLLAAAVQIWAEPKIIFTLSPKDFTPPPAVESAVIQLLPKPTTPNLDRYFAFLHVLFKQPRKTILNNLQFGLDLPKIDIEKHLGALGIPPQDRPHNLSLEQIQSLVHLFTS